MATKLNRNFAKPDAEMRPIFAPAAFNYNGKDYIHPEKEDFALIGYLPLSPDYPVDQPQGKHYVQTDKIESDGANGYRWQYILVDDPPDPPRRWTRLSIKNALADAHLLPAAKQFLAEFEMKPDYSALESFGDCNYIEENYGGAEAWNALLDGAAQALGKTREEIDAFLDAIPTEGGV